MKFDDTKILISDDSILARKQLKDILSQFGTPTFLEAANGQDAIDIYKKESPSLVFLDIVMPIKDGILCKKTKQNVQLHQFYIAFIIKIWDKKNVKIRIFMLEV